MRSSRSYELKARAALQQGLGPTGNAFQIQLELMSLDLVPLRKNLDQTEQRCHMLGFVNALRPFGHASDEPGGAV